MRANHDTRTDRGPIAKNKLLILVCVLVDTGAVAAGVLYVYWDQAAPMVGMATNYYRSWYAPAGTMSTELASGSSIAGANPASRPAPTAITGDWPSYNKTLTPAAPIAWNGLVLIGNAGGDNKGVKGRMYALDAKTGKIVWEFYLGLGETNASQ